MASLTTSILLILAWQYHPAIVLESLRDQVTNGSEEEALHAIRQLPAYEDAGLLIAVDALASERTAVAAEAQAVLRAEVDRWQFLPEDEAATRLDHLLSALAATSETRPPRAQDFVVSIALQALRWPTDSASHKSSLLAHCEHILRTSRTAAALEQRLRHQLADDMAADALAPSSERAIVNFVPPSSPEIALPGGSLPLPVITSPPPRPDQPKSAPGPTPEGQTASFVDQPLRFPQAAIARPIESSPTDGGHAIAQPEAPVNDDRAALTATTTVDLIRRLSRDVAGDSAVRTELASRGFGPVEFELASHFTNSDPAVRKKLVETLPRLRVDARPWLLWLSHDEDPDVRFAAAGLMATSMEPQMRRRLAELAASDPDSRIQQLASRVLQTSDRQQGIGSR